MNTARKIIGIIVTSISGVLLLLLLLILSYGIINENLIKYMVYSMLGVIIGVILIAMPNNKDRMEYEEYKRMKQQERAQLYRYADAKGKPITEYLMDDRTKLITYYDRLPSKYKHQLIEKADLLYRKFENEQYLEKK